MSLIYKTNHEKYGFVVFDTKPWNKNVSFKWKMVFRLTIIKMFLIFRSTVSVFISMFGVMHICANLIIKNSLGENL